MKIKRQNTEKFLMRVPDKIQKKYVRDESCIQLAL